LAALALATALASQPAASAAGEATIGKKVLVVRVEGTISTATEELVDLAISEAERENALVVVELNTPGGLLDSAFNIAIRIDRATVPVVGFVVEKWAESAGTLILVTCHVAAMQPGTIIGSMQPIEYDPLTGSYRPVNESKIINPILEFLDEHAGNKGRNMTAIRAFVLENLNLGAWDALKYGVVEYVATDVYDLLRQMNGSKVFLPLANKTYVIDATGAYVERFQPSLRTRIVQVLSDPMLSSLLLTIGLAVVLFSVIGGQFAVTPVGVLLLALGLLGSGYSVNATSIFLLAAGAALLAVELATPGFGVLGVTGIVMLTLGIALLPASGGYAFGREFATTLLYTAYAMGGAMGSLAGFAVYKVLKVRKRAPFVWTIEGKVGKALDDLSQEKEGFVFVEGEYWRAVSLRPVKAGEKVRVVKKSGPVLVVDRAEEGQPSS